MASLMFALAFLVGAAQQRVIKVLKANTRRIKQWSALILFLAGAWLIVLAIWADFFRLIFPV